MFNYASHQKICHIWFLSYFLIIKWEIIVEAAAATITRMTRSARLIALSKIRVSDRLSKEIQDSTRRQLRKKIVEIKTCLTSNTIYTHLRRINECNCSIMIMSQWPAENKRQSTTDGKIVGRSAMELEAQKWIWVVALRARGHRNRSKTAWRWM